MAMETLVVGKCGNASTPVELIKGDNYTQKIMMRVPRYFGGVDLAPLAWSVTVENAAGATDEYALSAIRGEDAIEMEWIPGGTATAVPGIVKFKLSGFGEDRNILVWQSGTYHIRVKDTFSHTPGSETETELTEVQKLIVYVDGELKNVIAAGNDARTGAAAANAAARRAEDAASSANSAAESASSAAVSANNAAASASTAAEAANAASGIIANEFKGLVDRLTTPFAEKDSVVTCYPVEGYPLDVKTILEPVQEGNGEPSPDNVRQITGHTGAKVTRCGKNLLPKFENTTLNGLTFTADEDGSVAVKGINSYQTSVEKTVHLKPGIYTLSGCPAGGSSSSADGNYAMFALIDGAYTFDTGSGAAFTVTTEGDCHFNIIIRANTEIDETFYPMVETGGVKTEYEPYQGETFSADFGQTVYGGTLDWGKGELAVDTAFCEFTGSEPCLAFEMLGSYARCQFYVAGAPMGETFGKGLFSHGVFKTDHYEDSAHVYVNELFWLFLPADSARDAGSAQAYLAAQYAAGTPVQIAYTLAEPYTIQFTPVQILALKGENNLWSDVGETEVSGATDPEYMTGTGGGNANITINGKRPDENGNFVVNTLNDVEIAQLQAVIT